MKTHTDKLAQRKIKISFLLVGNPFGTRKDSEQVETTEIEKNDKKKGRQAKYKQHIEKQRVEAFLLKNF